MEHLRRNGGAAAAKEFKGMRWLLLRNWENLAPEQKATLRELAQANTRAFRAWQLKEELREILSMPLAPPRGPSTPGCTTPAAPGSSLS